MKPMEPSPAERAPWTRARWARFLIGVGMLVIFFDVAAYMIRQSNRDSERTMDRYVLGYSFAEDVSMAPHLIVGVLAAVAILAGVILLASTPESKSEPIEDAGS